MIFISKEGKLSTIQNYSFPEGSKQKGWTEQSYLLFISFLKIKMVHAHVCARACVYHKLSFPGI